MRKKSQLNPIPKYFTIDRCSKKETESRVTISFLSVSRISSRGIKTPLFARRGLDDSKVVYIHLSRFNAAQPTFSPSSCIVRNV